MIIVKSLTGDSKPKYSLLDVSEEELETMILTFLEYKTIANVHIRQMMQKAAKIKDCGVEY
jgi:hypothetical protein